LILRYKTSDEVLHEDIDLLIQKHNIRGYHPSYHLEDEGRLFEYRMTIFTSYPKNFRALTEDLKSAERLLGFAVIPSVIRQGSTSNYYSS